MNIESLPLHEIAEKDKRRGYFLYHELKKRKIVGLHPGMSKNFRSILIGLKQEQVEYVANAFKDIARENGIKVENNNEICRIFNEIQENFLNFLLHRLPSGSSMIA